MAATSNAVVVLVNEINPTVESALKQPLSLAGAGQPVPNVHHFHNDTHDLPWWRKMGDSMVVGRIYKAESA